MQITYLSTNLDGEELARFMYKYVVIFVFVKL